MADSTLPFPASEMDAMVKAAAEALREQLAVAYRRGYEAAMGDVRARLFGHGAETSNGVQPDQAVGPVRSVNSAPVRPRRRSTKRAGHGEAARLIGIVFATKAGLTIKEIHNAIAGGGAALSVEAVGAELRRNEGTKYRREGRFWFPGGAAGGKTATGEVLGGTPQSPSDNANNGGRNATTTIT